jgi:hypothetical protein
MALDRTIRKTWGIGLCAALALAACSRTDTPVAMVKPPEHAARPLQTVHAEFTAFETSGSDLGDVLKAIHASEPTVYDKLVEIAASPSWTGTPGDAMQIGRPLYLSAFRGKLPYAADKDVNELIDIQIDMHKALLPSAPLLCSQGEKAELAEVGKYVPADVLARENRLQARVIGVADRSVGRATQAEIEDWKARTFKGDEPRMKGNVYFELTDPTPEQATAICDSEMFILEKMRFEKPERRAYLYRGLMSPR